MSTLTSDTVNTFVANIFVPLLNFAGLLLINRVFLQCNIATFTLVKDVNTSSTSGFINGCNSSNRLLSSSPVSVDS